MKNEGLQPQYSTGSFTIVASNEAEEAEEANQHETDATLLLPKAPATNDANEKNIHKRLASKSTADPAPDSVYSDAATPNEPYITEMENSLRHLFISLKSPVEHSTASRNRSITTVMSHFCTFEKQEQTRLLQALAKFMVIPSRTQAEQGGNMRTIIKATCLSDKNASTFFREMMMYLTETKDNESFVKQIQNTANQVKIFGCITFAGLVSGGEINWQKTLPKLQIEFNALNHNKLGISKDSGFSEWAKQQLSANHFCTQSLENCIEKFITGRRDFEFTRTREIEAILSESQKNALPPSSDVQQECANVPSNEYQQQINEVNKQKDKEISQLKDTILASIIKTTMSKM